MDGALEAQDDGNRFVTYATALRGVAAALRLNPRGSVLRSTERYGRHLCGVA